MWFSYRPYVSVSQRRAQAAKLTANLKKAGRTITPVTIEGRTIASTFWGKAWCDHLEAYSDFANRLPRGRTYVRNGSVIDMQIKPGKITALVSGSEVYEITVKIEKLAKDRWAALSTKCAGQVGSVLELLQGRLDKSVMTVLTDRKQGLFPAPAEISMKCSCPDWAGLCKHLAAVLYGVGARLDREPELLFVLRQVDHMELIEQAATAGALTKTAKAGPKTLADSDLADVFGIELDTAPAAPAKKPTKAPAKKPATARGRAARKPATTKAAPAKATPKKVAARVAASPKAVVTKAPAAKTRKAVAKPKSSAGRKLPK